MRYPVIIARRRRLWGLRARSAWLRRGRRVGGGDRRADHRRAGDAPPRDAGGRRADPATDEHRDRGGGCRSGRGLTGQAQAARRWGGGAAVQRALARGCGHGPLRARRGYRARRRGRGLATGRGQRGPRRAGVALGCLPARPTTGRGPPARTGRRTGGGSGSGGAVAASGRWSRGRATDGGSARDGCRIARGGVAQSVHSQNRPPAPGRATIARPTAPCGAPHPWHPPSGGRGSRVPPAIAPLPAPSVAAPLD